MDPLTAVVAAVVAGATQTVGSLVSDELTKAYGALKSKLLSMFGRDPVVEVTVEAVEANHESTRASAALTQALSERDLSDPELRELAERVLQAAGPARIDNAMRIAADAVAERNRVKVAAPPDFAGSIKNEMDVGERAEASDNDVSVSLNALPDLLHPD